MRRISLITSLTAVVALGLSACSSGNQAGPTRTTVVVVTETAGPSAAPGSSGAAPGSAITVVQPSPGSSGATSAAPTGSVAATGSNTAGSQAATTTGSAAASSTTETATTEPAEPIVKLDPLTADCRSLLTAADVKKILNTTISDSTGRIRDVANPDRNLTGKNRCQYGVSGDDAAVVIGLSKYTNAAAAQDQVDVTVTFEQDKGAVHSTVSVSGHEAQVLVREGGLIVVPYDNWTLAIAVDKTKIKADAAPEQLTELAELVLARVIKNAS